MGKYNNCTNRCTKESCELCSCINADPVNIEKHGSKLLTVRIKVTDVCPGKKVAIACIVYDEWDRIVAFKGFITIANRDNECDKSSCGTIERKIVFVLPEGYECDTSVLKIRTTGNYIYPCD